MSNTKSKQQSPRLPEEAHSVVDLARRFRQDDTKASAREALTRAFEEIDSKNRKRAKRINKLRYLVFELQSIQPAELPDISLALGQSLNTTRDQLKKLIKLDLVVRVSFEKHTLYCLNGHYKQLINNTLLNGLFD